MPPILFGKQLLSALLFLALLGAPLQGAAQPQKPLHIADLSYTYRVGVVYDSFNTVEKDFFYPRKRVLFAKNDSMRSRMGEIMDRSIRKMWNCTPETAFLRLKSTNHAFKPKAPNDTTRENFLFFDVFDAQTPEWNYISGSKEWHLTGAVLKMDCKIVTGGSKKPLFSRTMKVIMNRNPIPEGEYGLSKLPCLPDSFMAAFNRAIEIFFGPDTPPDSIEFFLPPACLYQNLKKEKQVNIPFYINISDNHFVMSGGKGFEWQMGAINSKKEKTKPYVVENIFRILLESPEVSKKLFVDRIPFYFSDDTSVLLLTIPHWDDYYDGYVERRKVFSRCYITRATDTLCGFEFLQLLENQATDTSLYFWDGYDSSTVRAMPNSWTNRGLYQPTWVRGTLYQKIFEIKNGKAGNMLDITYDDKLIATLKTSNGVPKKGYLYYADLPEETLRALMVLATLPFAYYGEY